jgi:hypothetical protein
MLTSGGTLVAFANAACNAGELRFSKQQYRSSQSSAVTSVLDLPPGLRGRPGRSPRRMLPGGVGRKSSGAGLVRSGALNSSSLFCGPQVSRPRSTIVSV